MNFKEFLKTLPEEVEVKLKSQNGDKLFIKHEYSYVFSIRLNKTKPRDFLITEAATWLHFYESKRGKLSLVEEVVPV